MGLFDGLGDAEIFERGNYLPPDFAGVLEVQRTLAKESVKSGIGFIVEFKVIQVDQPGEEDHERSPVREGQKRTWWQGMKDKTVAFPAIKEFMAVLSGYETHQKEEIAQDVAPHVGEATDYAVDNPDDNDLIGLRIYCSTRNKITKNQRDFTLHIWKVWNEPQESEGSGAG